MSYLLMTHNKVAGSAITAALLSSVAMSLFAVSPAQANHSAATCQSNDNLLVNCSFQLGSTTGWTIGGSGYIAGFQTFGTVPAGSSRTTFYGINDAATVTASQTFTTVKDATYKVYLNAWQKTSGGTSQITVNFGGNTLATLNSLGITATKYQYDSIVAGSAASTLDILLKSAGGSNLYINETGVHLTALPPVIPETSEPEIQNEINNENTALQAAILEMPLLDAEERQTVLNVERDLQKVLRSNLAYETGKLGLTRNQASVANAIERINIIEGSTRSADFDRIMHAYRLDAHTH